MSHRAAYLCPKGCKAGSQIEHTDTAERLFVHRLRACKECGQTWSTAEVLIEDWKLLKRYKRLAREFARD